MSADNGIVTDYSDIEDPRAPNTGTDYVYCSRCGRQLSAKSSALVSEDGCLFCAEGSL